MNFKPWRKKISNSRYSKLSKSLSSMNQWKSATSSSKTTKTTMQILKTLTKSASVTSPKILCWTSISTTPIYQRKCLKFKRNTIRKKSNLTPGGLSFWPQCCSPWLHCLWTLEFFQSKKEKYKNPKTFCRLKRRCSSIQYWTKNLSGFTWFYSNWLIKVRFSPICAASSWFQT